MALSLADTLVTAVRLRLWDDLARAAGLATPPLAHFLAHAQRCVMTA